MSPRVPERFNPPSVDREEDVMRQHLIVAGALLLSCGFASAQKPDPVDGY
jgi:hypothetical protein